jgi:spore coat protein U-like protein
MVNRIAARSMSIMRRLLRRSFLLSLTAATLVGSTLSDSQAGTITGTFAVTATISGAACTSISATALSFGTLAPTATASSTSTVTVNCANGTAYSISAVGTLPYCSANTPLNGMLAPNQNTVFGAAYSLFKDAAHTLPLAGLSIIGCGTTPGTAITGTGSGTGQTQTIYGLVYGTIPGNLSSPSGNYTDTATVTVTF